MKHLVIIAFLNNYCKIVSYDTLVNSEVGYGFRKHHD